MKPLVASVLIAFAGAGQSVAPAMAVTAEDNAEPTRTSAPTRPGGKTHFPRGGFKLDNKGHPVTGQGPNMGTKTLKDTLEAAGVPNY